MTKILTYLFSHTIIKIKIHDRGHFLNVRVEEDMYLSRGFRYVMFDYFPIFLILLTW